MLLPAVIANLKDPAEVVGEVDGDEAFEALLGGEEDAAMMSAEVSGPDGDGTDEEEEVSQSEDGKESEEDVTSTPPVKFKKRTAPRVKSSRRKKHPKCESFPSPLSLSSPPPL